jgi:hypothetical protein
MYVAVLKSCAIRKGKIKKSKQIQNLNTSEIFIGKA